MILFLKVLIAISCLCLLHSYVIYPFLLRLLSNNKKPNQQLFSREDDLPLVSVIMSVYNEESVIAEKLESLLSLNYPEDKLRIYIGSDCSADQTNDIIESFAKNHPMIRFFPFQKRQGKPGVVNELTRIVAEGEALTDAHIFLVTDASVMLAKDTLFHLVKHFKNPEITIVDANMVHTGMKAEGISKSENQYISGEVLLKHREGLVWGKMIGPFGGCYAIRSNYFSKVPDNFLVDDFYITMRVFERGGMAINELEAVCYEPVSHEMKEEYRRKSRISAGNFQNMSTFPHLWWPPFKQLNFAFFSHKILRWLGPFFLLIIVFGAGILYLADNIWYGFLFLLVTIGSGLVFVLDYLLKLLKINIMPLRSVRYFLVMNMALFEGFFKFLKGIRSNAWEPPKRN